MHKLIPHPAEIGREMLIVIGGALLAAFFFSQFPALKKYVHDNLNS